MTDQERIEEAERCIISYGTHAGGPPSQMDTLQAGTILLLAYRSEKSRADNLSIVAEAHKTAAAEHEANEDALAKELAEAKADANTYAKSSDKWKHDYDVLNAVRHLESLPRPRACEAKLEQAQAKVEKLQEELKVLKALHYCLMSILMRNTTGKI